MATAQRATSSHAVSQRTPTVIAIERLAKLASSGASPARLVATVEDVLAIWGAEEIGDSDMRERIEVLQSDIDAGVEAAQEYAAEAETPGQKKAAAAQVAGLTAVRDRLAVAVAGR